MEIFYQIDNINLKSSVITMGSYDGIHRGHFHIINKVNSISNQLNTSSVVITFDPHPRNLIGKPKEKVKLLMSLEKKIELIKSFSIDYLVILKFDTKLLILFNTFSLITFEESKIKRFKSQVSNSSNSDLDILLLKKRLFVIIPGVSTKVN